MGNLERRLRALEANRQDVASGLSREALKHLSDEDLDALEDALEAGQADGTATFEELYSVVGERSRRALEAYTRAVEVARRGEEPPSHDPPQSPPPGLEYLEDEEAIGTEWEKRNGYRIWKYRKKGA